MADDGGVLLRIVPDPFVRSVGRVVTQWAWAEGILDQYIWRLLGVRGMRGRIITSNLPARTKIEALAALLRKSRFDENFIREVEDEGKALANLRNLVAHGYIAVPPDRDTGVIVSYAARGELRLRSRQITAPLLDKLAARIALYTQFLIEGSTRLPKQRGQQRAQGYASPKPRRLRPDTTARRHPPLLEVERLKGLTDGELKAARVEKRARKAEQALRSQANDPRRKVAR